MPGRGGAEGPLYRWVVEDERWRGGGSKFELPPDTLPAG